MNTSLSTSAIIKKVWGITLPVVSSRLFNVINSFLGILFVARLGHTELAASSLITATQIPLFLIASSPLFSISVIAGHAYGAKQTEKIGAILQQGWLLSLMVAAIAIIIPLSIKSILLTLKQDPILADIAGKYFFIYAFAIPATLCFMSMQQFFIAIGKQRYVLWLSGIGLVGFVFLAPLLIYGYGFIPGLGVPGLALASTLQIWINLIISLIICIKDPDMKVYEIFAWRILSTFNYLKQLVKIGWPITLQMTGDLLSLFVLTIIIGWLGENALAANQIATQYYILLVVPILAMSQASSVLISQARGAGNFDLIKRYGNTAAIMGAAFALLVTLIFILCPHELIKLYLHSNNISDEIMHLATVVLILMGGRLIFDTILEIKIGNLRGLLDVRWPMGIMLSYIWIFSIPASYFAGIVFHYGLIGISVVNVVTTLLAAFTLWLRWQKKSAEFSPEKMLLQQQSFAH